MSTPFDILIEAFLKRIEKDRDFFSYFNLSDDEAMELAKTRATNYLVESVNLLMLKCTPDIDFNNYDITTKEFNEELTNQEVFLVSSLMYEMYLDRDIAKLKCLNVNFTSSDLRVFDPSNARSTFMQMYEVVRQKNEVLIDNYKSRDRLTNKLKSINHANYEY